VLHNVSKTVSASALPDSGINAFSHDEKVKAVNSMTKYFFISRDLIV
jgi:hypothetical protein